MAVAQLVELLVVVQAVAGSSPVSHPKGGCGPSVKAVLEGSASRWGTHRCVHLFSGSRWRSGALLRRICEDRERQMPVVRPAGSEAEARR